jgi:hypothetical protein
MTNRYGPFVNGRLPAETTAGIDNPGLNTVMNDIEADIVQLETDMSTHAHAATEITTTTSGFDGVLSAADDEVQKALDTLDNHSHALSDFALTTTNFDGNLSGTDTDVQTAFDTIDDLYIPGLLMDGYAGEDSTHTNTYAITIAAPIQSYYPGLLIDLLVSHPNDSSTVTLNINSLGPLPIDRIENNGVLLAGDVTNAHQLLYCNGSAFYLINPAQSLSAGSAAADITVDADAFSGNLSNTDTDVQTALATIDGLTIGGGSYTDEEAQDAVGTILADSDTVDFTYTDGTPEITAAVKKQMSLDSDSSGLK